MDFSAYRYEVVDLPDDYPPRVKFEEENQKYNITCFPRESKRAVHVATGMWLGDRRRSGPHPREMDTEYTLHSGPYENWSMFLREKLFTPKSHAMLLGKAHGDDVNAEKYGFLSAFSIIAAMNVPKALLDGNADTIERFLELLMVCWTEGALLRMTMGEFRKSTLGKHTFRYESKTLGRSYERVLS